MTRLHQRYKLKIIIIFGTESQKVHRNFPKVLLKVHSPNENEISEYTAVAGGRVDFQQNIYEAVKALL